MPKIKFLKEKDKEKKEIEVEKGINLRKAMMTAGINPYSDFHTRTDSFFGRLRNCGGKGSCGTCRVHIKEGMENAGEMGTLEKWRIKLSLFAIGHEDEVRLSCQTTVEGDMTVEERPDFNWSGTDRRTPNVRSGNIDEVIF